jgi:hypothetical protein
MKPERYNERFPKRPPLTTSKDGLVAGTWLIGACYKNPNPLYGAYPHGYLERVHSMFPDARSVLHVFSGGLTVFDARAAAWPIDTLPRDEDGTAQLEDRNTELVDMHGPEEGRFPTWQGDLFDMPKDWHARFDLILADPPYSADDAEKYATPMINRARVTSHLRAFAKTGGHMVWLDQVWPMHSKKRWKTVGQVGLVRSTNHRVRLVTFFEAV